MTTTIPVIEVSPDEFVRWQSGMTVTRIFREAVQTVAYADGRREEGPIAVTPYPAEMWLVTLANLTPEELADHGIALAEPFVASEGKRATGEERFARVDGVVRQIFDEEDIPLPAPEPTREEKVATFLAGIGLTKDDFAAVILGEKVD